MKKMAKKWNKLAGMLLMGTMMFSLAGCGSQQTAVTTPSEETVAESAAQESSSREAGSEEMVPESTESVFEESQSDGKEADPVSEAFSAIPEADFQEEESTESAQIFEASAIYHGLTITASYRTADRVTIRVQNTSPDSYAFGWVSGPTITCTTATGVYYYTLGPDMVPAGAESSCECYFDGATGEVISISISDVIQLDSRGLPEGFGSGATVTISFDESAQTAEASATEEVVLQGTGSYGSLAISVKGSAKRMTVTYTSTGAEGYSLGWVNGPTITCRTTKGEYYCTAPSSTILAGGSVSDNYYFDTAEGDLVSITISGINTLSERGLPSDFSGGGSVTIIFQ